MKIGVPKETFPGERRVALTPNVLQFLTKAGFEILIESGAGTAAGFPDTTFEEKGAKIVSRADVFANANVVLQVRGPGANKAGGLEDLKAMKSGQINIAFQEPLTEFQEIKAFAESGVTSLSMELMPRITRAQSMDALSSNATVAGYKAVLMAAAELPKMFPMMMTAAGTISPAKVFIVGCGVAGLQAIATAKRLGAVVHAYDIRPAVREQIESLGGKFVEIELDSGDAEDKGGYAREMDEAFYKKQREMMMKVLAESDVVITTAAIPGKKAPILVTKEMVAGMNPGSVVVDLAAERGGNCEDTKPGENVDVNGVTVMGPENLPSEAPYHASQMYAKNITTFLLHMTKDGVVQLDEEDEIIQGTLLTKGGEICHARIRELMGLSTGS
jgi:NAD(P) transhydrogenase subunit alpha